MTFAEIPVGAALFLDAKTFIYHFTAQSKYGLACTSLLERIERAEILGWTSAHVLAEVSHRLMTIEACILFGWPVRNVASRLASHPQEISRLSLFQRALIAIETLSLRIVPTTAEHLVNAATVSRQHGLLTNDALLIAVMAERGLTNLATNDADFDRVPGITRFAPV